MTDDFADFELVGWRSASAGYDAGFGSLTVQSVEPLLDVCAVTAGTRVLDVATGPGYAAQIAAARGADVIGIDFAAPMIDRARRRVPAAAFNVGDAETLPFNDAAFDAAIMNFGLLHLARPESALQEAARVLRDGGRFAFTVWAPPEDAVAFGIILRAVAAHGDPAVSLPAGPPFFRFSEPSECERALRDADFVQTAVTRVHQAWRLPTSATLFDVMLHGTVRTAGLLRAQRPQALAAIRRAVAADAAGWRMASGSTAGAIELPMPAVLASGIRQDRTGDAG